MGNKEQKPQSSEPFIRRIHDLTLKLFKLERDKFRELGEQRIDIAKETKEEDDGRSKFP